MKILVKLLIVRYHFIRLLLSKPHLACTFFDKYIDVRECDRNFGLYEYFLCVSVSSTDLLPVNTTININEIKEFEELRAASSAGKLGRKAVPPKI